MGIEISVVAIVWLFICGGLGTLTAYQDLDSFFQAKRTAYVSRGGPAILFLAGMGLLSAGLLLWAMSSDAASPINEIIQANSVWGKALVVGFGVPMLIRSKLFSFGESERPAGPALLYEWLRRRVLHDIALRSANEKNRIATEYGPRLAASGASEEDLWDLAFDAAKPFLGENSDEGGKKLRAGFDKLDGRFVGTDRGSARHFSKLIRWALDHAGSFRYVEKQLARLSNKPARGPTL